MTLIPIILNPPNILSLIRIASVPLFLVLLSSHIYDGALLVFVIGGITDALDGPLARITNQKTRLGTYLDPLADKLLIISSLVVLSFIRAVPFWLTVLVVSRDLIVTIGYGAIYFLIEERMEIQPSLIGKINNFLLLLLITVILISLYASELIPMRFISYLSFCVALTTFISGVQYVRTGWIWFRERTHASNRPS